MDMDSEFERTIDRLIESAKSHPNLSKLWMNYVLLKKTAYENALREANNMIEALSNTQDPDHETLIAMFALSQVMRASNR